MEKNIEPLVTELNELDKEWVAVDGGRLRPSQCYYFEPDPLHVLFNTNCPEALKEKVNAIIAKHVPGYESSTSSEGKNE
jgi:hypothetical protein